MSSRISATRAEPAPTGPLPRSRDASSARKPLLPTYGSFTPSSLPLWAGGRTIVASCGPLWNWESVDGAVQSVPSAWHSKTPNGRSRRSSTTGKRTRSSLTRGCSRARRRTAARLLVDSRMFAPGPVRLDSPVRLLRSQSPPPFEAFYADSLGGRRARISLDLCARDWKYSLSVISATSLPRLASSINTVNTWTWLRSPISR
jgi:hypothetical protein